MATENNTKNQEFARLHRFRNHVAISFGTGETTYLSPQDAKDLAYTLARIARDVDQVKFSRSGIGTYTLTSTEPD